MFTMKRIEYLVELIRLKDEATKLEKKSELDLKTAKFYGGVIDGLMKKLDDESLPYDEREKVLPQLEELLKKLKYEKRMGNKDDSKIKAILDGLAELDRIKKQNLFED